MIVNISATYPANGIRTGRRARERLHVALTLPVMVEDLGDEAAPVALIVTTPAAATELRWAEEAFWTEAGEATQDGVAASLAEGLTAKDPVDIADCRLIQDGRTEVVAELHRRAAGFRILGGKLLRRVPEPIWVLEDGRARLSTADAHHRASEDVYRADRRPGPAPRGYAIEVLLPETLSFDDAGLAVEAAARFTRDRMAAHLAAADRAFFDAYATLRDLTDDPERSTDALAAALSAAVTAISGIPVLSRAGERAVAALERHHAAGGDALALSAL